MASMSDVTVRVKPEIDWSSFPIKDVSVLRLQPGDLVLVECERGLSPDEARTIKAAWQTRLPGAQVMVTSGMRTTVVRDERSR